jgi:hypothetical protein
MRRSSGRVTNVCPQDGQNRASSGASAPHDPHVMRPG